MFFAFEENHVSPFDFMDTDNVQKKAQGRMDGWKTFGGFEQRKRLYVALCLFLVLSSPSFSLLPSLRKGLDEHVFPMLLSVDSDEKHLSFLEALYPFLKIVSICHFL